MHNYDFFCMALIFTFLLACKKETPEVDNLDCDDPNSGLVISYSFDEQIGLTAFDCTSNSLNGVLQGVNWSLDVGNKSEVEFKGNGILDIPSFITGSEMKHEPEIGTISVTFKFRNFNGNIQPIVYYGESDAASPHNSLIIEIGHKMDTANQKLYFTIVNARFCFDSNANLEEETWYHFVAVVSSKGNTGYLNGVELTNRHYNLGSNSTYTDFFSSVPVKEIFTLGYGRYGMCADFFYLDGYIGDFRVYNRALTGLEVNKLYHKLL